MSYLKFEKAQMTNLQESLRRELLCTNRSGAYSCSTVVDCNTRKYHGLLVVPVPEIDGENHVLLSSLDCSVIQHGAQFNLGVHKYESGVFSPNGHKYIREFSLENVPTTIYRVGGVILKKEIIFQVYSTRVLIRYTLLDCHSATTLQLRPFLAFRSVKNCMVENPNINRDYTEIDGGIKTQLYPNYPNLYIQISKKNKFVFDPHWNKSLVYEKEQERGYHGVEDLYVPGYFEIQAKKGDEIVISAGIEEIKPESLKKLFNEEVGLRLPIDSFYHALVNAAHQFHVRVSDTERYLLAGYPWFKVRARDTFIALPGLTLAIQENDYFELVMDTAAKSIRDFMTGKPLKSLIHEIEQPDVLLWAIWAIQQYAHEVGNAKAFKKYGKLLIAGCIGAVCLYIAVSGLSGLARAGAVTAVIGGALLLELVICGVMQGDMQRITELHSTGGLAEEIYRGIALGGGSGCLPVLLGSVRGAPLRSLLRTFMSRALFAVIFLLSAELLAAPVMAISDFPAVMAAQLSQPFPSQRIDALFMIVFSCIAVYSITVQTVTAALIAGELIPSCKRYAPAVILLLMTAGAVILEHSGSTSPVIAGMNIIALILLPAAHIIRTKMRIENA